MSVKIDDKQNLRTYYVCECDAMLPTFKALCLHGKVCSKYKENIITKVIERLKR